MRYVASIGLGVALALLAVRPGHAAPVPKEPAGLVATIRAGEKPDTVEVEFRNRTAVPAGVDRYTIERGVIVLEVIDAAGEVVPPVPPSVPPAELETVTIPAGGSHKQTYKMRFFSPDLTPGRYRVRVRLKGWSSNDFSYEVPAGK